MNKKLIISKTVTFVAIVAFIVMFKTIFGNENTLIGVTTVTAMLMFLERDLTLNPIKNTAKFIVLNLFIGIGAIVASSNMWLAIPINFVVVFSLSYLLCYNIKKPMYLPFTLQYLFILTSPVSVDKIPLRLLSLVVGAILIMVTQLIANKNRLSKLGNKLLRDACSSLLIKIDNFKNGNIDESLNENIIKLISEFRKAVYEKREESFYFTEEGRIKLNLSMGIEKITFLIDKIDYKSDNEDILEDIYIFIEKIRDSFDDENKIKELDVYLDKIIRKHGENHTNDLISLQIINNALFIDESFNELQVLGKEKYNLIKKIEEIPEEFKKSILSIENIKKTYLKFSYAIRIAFAIALGGFIMDFFNFSEGRWILFTMLSLVSPLYEVSSQKTKDRMISTIIGSIIVFTLFEVFKDTTIRTIILMLSGYIASYTTKYKYNMICVTISAIGAAALSGTPGIFTINRIIFVAVGATLAILINKFILPYKLEDSHRELKVMYDETIQLMLKNIYDLVEKTTSSHGIKNLIVVTSLIEEKMKLNIQAIENDDEYDFMIETRLLVNNIYELYICISRNRINEADIKYILEDLKILSEYKKVNIDDFIKQVESHINKVDDVNNKMILSIVLEILLELK